MKNMGKIAVILLGNLVMLVMLLTGCGGENSEKQEAEEVEDTSITLLASQNWIKEIDRTLFRKFEEETGIEVQVLLTPDNGFKTLVSTCLAGGNAAVDMFMFPIGSALGSMGLQDVALDLSGEPWADRLEDWALEAGSYDGKLLGFSTWGVDYEGIIYNKTFFQEHDLEVPDTWEGFLKLCDQICSLGTVPLYEGINGSWHTRSWVDGLTPVMYQERPDLVEYLNAGPEHRLADIKCFRSGLEQIRELFATKEGGVPRYYIGDGQDEDFNGSYQYLTERKAVMMFTYSAYVSELEEYGSKDEWGMFPVPLLDNKTAISNGGGMAKFINKYSQKIQECKLLFDFLARQENLEEYYRGRSDLAIAAFKGVDKKMPETTSEILQRSQKPPVVMFAKDVYYTDPNIYQYIQGFAEGTCSVDQFIQNYDTYRENMFQGQ